MAKNPPPITIQQKEAANLAVALALGQKDPNYVRQRPNTMLTPIIEQWKNQYKRTTPNLVPTIDGKVVSITEYENFIRDNLHDLHQIYTRVVLQERSGPGSVKWDDISAAHTKAGAGAGNVSPFETIVNDAKYAKDPRKTIFTGTPPTGNLAQWCVDELKKYYKRKNFGVTDGGPVSFLVIYEPGGSEPSVAYEAQGQFLEKREDGSFAARGRTSITNDPDSFYPHDKSGSIFTPKGPYKDDSVNAGIALDIEHILESVAVGQIKEIKRNLEQTLRELQGRQGRTKNPEKLKVINDAIRNVSDQIAVVEKNKQLAEKVGRLVSLEKLPPSVKRDDLLKLVDSLPSVDGFKGIYGVYYKEVTGTIEARNLTLNHSLEIPFIPGLSKFNRGLASAVEKLALNNALSAAGEIASTPALAQVLIAGLAVSLDDPTLLKEIKKSRKGKKKVGDTFLPVAKEAKVKKPKKAKKGKVKAQQTKKGPTYAGLAAAALAAPQMTVPMVAQLNLMLKEAVIDEMYTPRLVNRTGQFAASARIMGVTPAGALAYTYRKSPYRVFSTSEGSSPWNSRRERDPGFIISQAINSVTKEKFGRVFRTELK
jgi:hypothetical protein